MKSEWEKKGTWYNKNASKVRFIVVFILYSNYIFEKNYFLNYFLDFFYYFDVLMLKINFKNKNIILIYF